MKVRQTFLGWSSWWLPAQLQRVFIGSSLRDFNENLELNTLNSSLNFVWPGQKAIVTVSALCVRQKAAKKLQAYESNIELGPLQIASSVLPVNLSHDPDSDYTDNFLVWI